eukprot:jgi/Bigna1/86822/estExt_fgenesh1_pg.C_140076
MRSWLFGSGEDTAREKGGTDSKSSSTAGGKPPIMILAVDSAHKSGTKWENVFKGSKIPECDRPIKVVQCGWDDFHVMADGPHTSTSCIINVRTEIGGVKRVITVKPDFVLIRNEVTALSHDNRNKLYGLMYANVPSVNSLSSIYMFCERPIVQGELNRLAKLHKGKGPDNEFLLVVMRIESFPGGNNRSPVLNKVPQSYFASYQGFFYGYGKMKVANHKDMEMKKLRYTNVFLLIQDFKSVLAVADKYCTAEPFIDGKYDLRIQKIGNKYRAFKRISVSGTWKTNTQSSHVEVIPLTKKYKFWADEAANMFGGLDILTVDAIHNAKDGKEYIMEVNGTSSGLLPTHQEEDDGHIRDLVLEKLNSIFGQQRELENAPTKK